MSNNSTGSAVVESPRGALALASGVSELLEEIRPEWQAKSLIVRVRRLLPVDPSSACQRLLNAAIRDLKNKIVIAGVDLASEAASTNKLPPVTRNEDVLENYSTNNTLDLAYRIGIISRPEWRKLKRAYDIRRDLEHEDHEYEADIEDCIYVFHTCVEYVLSREPIELLRVDDVKEMIEAQKEVAPSRDYLQDYHDAPDPRQLEICKYLVEIAKNSKKPDILRQNAVETLRAFRHFTRDGVKIILANLIQERSRRRPYGVDDVKIAAAGGFTGYLKKRKLAAFFKEFCQTMKNVSYRWTRNSEHPALMDSLEDFGGIDVIPREIRKEILLWLVLCYVGEPGWYGQFGHSRKVFFSNSAAHRIREFIKQASIDLSNEFDEVTQDKRVKAAIKDTHVARRLDTLRDIIDTFEESD